MNFRDSIDASAEREALAIEELAEITGLAVARTRLQQRRDEAIAAAALGRADVKHTVYARAASRRAHAKITDANRKLLVWGPRDKYPRPPEDVTARAVKYFTRMAKLRELARSRQSQWVRIAEAARMSAIGERTIQRACLSGTVKAHRDFTASNTNGVGDRGRYLVQVRDVRRLLELKLSRRTIAVA